MGDLILKGQGNVDVQIGGPGNPWQYLSACASMSGPSVTFGGTEVRWCQDPNQSGGYKYSVKFRSARDLISFDIMTKLEQVQTLSDLECEFGARARYLQCGKARTDPANYDPIMLVYSPVDLQSKDYDDLVSTDPGDEDEIPVTGPSSALYEHIIQKMVAPVRVGTLATLGDQPINALTFCGVPSCGDACGARSDGCTTLYAVTDADTSPYANPNLIIGTKDILAGTVTYDWDPILVLGGNAESVACAGDRLLVSSNADGGVAYNDTPADQDTWYLVATTNAPTNNPNALVTRTAREVWVACNGGAIAKSTDGGLSYTDVLAAGTLTGANYNAVWAYDADLIYACAADGTVARSKNGGLTWAAMTAPNPGVETLCIVVPPNRSREVYVGTADGQIFRSKDQGDTWSNMAFSGSGAGTIDMLRFVGPYSGEVLFALHTDAGNRSRVLRDLSGGALGSDVEVVLGYTQMQALGVHLNAIAVCNVNNALAGGENQGGYPELVDLA